MTTNNIHKRFHFMTPMREIYTVTLYSDNIFDNVDGGKLFSKTSSAWTVLNDKFIPEQFLDIAPNEQILGIFRGRWLLVKRPIESFSVSCNNEIITQHKMYVYDIISARTFDCDHVPEGRYISVDSGARDLVTGEIFNSSLLTNFEMIDIEPISVPTAGTDARPQPLRTKYGTPILSASPGSPGGVGLTPEQKFIYVLKPRSKIREYSVYIGPQWSKGVKLNPVTTVTGYWHVAWPWIAYGNQVDNLLDAKKNFKLDLIRVASGITLKLTDVYFVSVNTLVAVYESQNYQAIIAVNL